MRLPFVLALGAALAGCGSTDMASMPIQGSDHSLTLVREKPYAWSAGWDLAVVVTRMPDCQRRHHLTLVERTDGGPDHQAQARKAPDVWQRKTRSSPSPRYRRDLNPSAPNLRQSPVVPLRSLKSRQERGGFGRL